MRTSKNTIRWALGLLTILGLTGVAAGQTADTSLDEVVLYLINNDEPCKLVRCTFNSSSIMVVGEVVDEDGNQVTELQSLTYIPDGDHKGFYA